MEPNDALAVCCGCAFAFCVRCDRAWHGIEFWYDRKSCYCFLSGGLWVLRRGTGSVSADAVGDVQRRLLSYLAVIFCTRSVVEYPRSLRGDRLTLARPSLTPLVCSPAISTGAIVNEYVNGTAEQQAALEAQYGKKKIDMLVNEYKSMLTRHPFFLSLARFRPFSRDPIVILNARSMSMCAICRGAVLSFFGFCLFCR